jgi:hypothetical protein
LLSGAELAGYAAEDFTAAIIRVVGRGGPRHRTDVVIAKRVGIAPDAADEAVVGFKPTYSADVSWIEPPASDHQ